jgi:transcriptional regulator with XRE-family HTH domain
MSTDVALYDFAARILEMRQKANLTQAVLAELIGVSHRTISTWEIGTRQASLANVVKVAAFTGCDPGYIFVRKPSRREDRWPG